VCSYIKILVVKQKLNEEHLPLHLTPGSPPAKPGTYRRFSSTAPTQKWRFYG
jgi:hypothetical protein